MKLRISGNFLRFRLSKTEVAHFGVNGRIEERTRFGGQESPAFVCELVKSAAENVSAVFKNGKLTIFIPRAIAEKWVNSDDVGFVGFQEIDGETRLKILVEKDFAFLKPKLEDDSENYPHPLKTAVRT